MLNRLVVFLDRLSRRLAELISAAVMHSRGSFAQFLDEAGIQLCQHFALHTDATFDDGSVLLSLRLGVVVMAHVVENVIGHHQVVRPSGLDLL
jgi:hypothetical protein